MADSSASLSKRSRLGDCEVCAKAAAKYTCPECEVKTCSLPCVKIHKTELECDGVRSRVKFRRLNKLSSLDLLSDYRLLEETNRIVSTARISNSQVYRQNVNFFSNPRKGSGLIFGAKRKEVGLKLLPTSFTERKNNTTRYLKNRNEFLWKIKWIFRQAEDQEFVEHNVSDSIVLGDLLSKYLSSENCKEPTTRTRMLPFHGKGLHQVEVLLPAQGVPWKKFFLMNLQESIADNLKYKNVVEYPTFHVILDSHLVEYNIVHIVSKNNRNFLEYNGDDQECNDEEGEEEVH